MAPDDSPNQSIEHNIPRMKRIIDEIDGGEVLDIGCVGESIDYDSGEWLHGSIETCADRLKGIDVDASGINELQERGWDVEYDDAESLNTVTNKYDFVVAAEVIEHLACPGNMFKSVSEVLRPKGRFLLTTPNPWSFVYFRRNIIQGYPHEKEGHTCWFDSNTMQELASRYGFTGEVEYLPPVASGLSSAIYSINKVIGSTRIYANFELTN